MPIQRSKDTKGPFYRWGTTGHRYYYISNNKTSRDKAYEKARKQGIAIKISQNFH